MPAGIPRRVINGQVRCSLCKHPRPVSWYDKDQRAPLRIGYQCRACRPKGNKLKVVEPDYDVIHVSKIALLQSAPEKIAANAWERVIQRAAICTRIERVVVYVGKNYFSRHAAVNGLFRSARRIKMRISVQHGKNEVYVVVKGKG